MTAVGCLGRLASGWNDEFCAAEPGFFVDFGRVDSNRNANLAIEPARPRGE